MKFMKIGTRPDTFYTEEAVRTLVSEAPSDLSVKINNITYHLHKFALLPRCGLLQRLCDETVSTSASSEIELHDSPGGEEAFEACVKFCYGITINLGAHNVVAALCAAKLLRMNESVEKGNLVLKLEKFFNSCVLEGWKDSIVALQTTVKLPEWSENLGIIRKCIDSVVEKILTPPTKVSWSYTYTRPGYNKKQHSVPKDWWTEDVSDLDVDMFRCILTALRALDVLPLQLIGEALHVYAARWLPDVAKLRSHLQSSQTSRKTFEAVVSLIPSEKGSVSVGFLLRLLSAASVATLGVSPGTKSELMRKCGKQLDEARVEELVFPLVSGGNGSNGGHFYDIDLVQAVVESYLVTCRRQADGGEVVRSLRKVGTVVDCYLQVVAKDGNMPVSKVVALAESIPHIARDNHDDLYKAINVFLKEHPDLNKAEKKRLCRILDCQKLSAEVRAHAVKNERLPLRTVVQLLFFDQDPRSNNNHHNPASTLLAHNIDKLAKLSLQHQSATSTSARGDGVATSSTTTTTMMKRSYDEKVARRGDNIIEEVEGMGVPKLDVRNMSRKGSKGRDR